MSDRFHVFKQRGLLVRRRPRNKTFFNPSFYLLTSATGTFSVTGIAALFVTLQSAAAGSFSVIGNTSNLKIGMTSVFGSFSVTGIAAAFLPAMLGASAAYIVTGNAVTFTRDFEAWFPRPFDTDTWTSSTKQAETWTPATKQAETWTPDPVTARHPPVTS